MNLAEEITNLTFEERYDEALEKLRSVLEQGTAWAEGLLGVMYHLGRGISRGLEQAEKLMRRAADKGYGPAAHNLGSLMMEYKMNGAERADPMVWYRKAQALGFQVAQDEFYVITTPGRRTP